MRMRAHDGCGAPVEVPSEGNFFGTGFGVEIHEHDLGLNLFQQAVGVAKRVVAGAHEHAALKIDDGVCNAVLLAFVHAPAGQALREVRRPQQAARRTMRVAVGHLEVFDDFAFIPDVIAGSHHVDTQIEKLLRQRRRDAESGSGIFAIGNDQIDGVLLAQFGEAILYDRAAGAPKNVADKKNFQDSMVSR